MTSMQPILLRISGEHKSGALSAEAISGQRDVLDLYLLRLTAIEFLERPFTRNHRAILLLLLLLTDSEIDK